MARAPREHLRPPRINSTVTLLEPHWRHAFEYPDQRSSDWKREFRFDRLLGHGGLNHVVDHVLVFWDEKVSSSDSATSHSTVNACDISDISTPPPDMIERQQRSAALSNCALTIEFNP